MSTCFSAASEPFQLMFGIRVVLISSPVTVCTHYVVLRESDLMGFDYLTKDLMGFVAFKHPPPIRNRS